MERPAVNPSADPRFQTGAVVLVDGRLYTVIAYELRGVNDNQIVAEDFITGRNVEMRSMYVRREALLIRNAPAGPSEDEIPMSTECLIEDARAARLAG